MQENLKPARPGLGKLLRKQTTETRLLVTAALYREPGLSFTSLATAQLLKAVVIIANQRPVCHYQKIFGVAVQSNKSVISFEYV